MKLLLAVLAAVLLSGCAIVPAPYPYAAVPEPGVSVGVGIGIPVYRGGGHSHHHPYHRAPYRGGHYRRW
jgi:hypothetical protein